VFDRLRRFAPEQLPLGLQLYNFVDALHFADSRETFGLQLADCAAFLIKRHLMERSDSEVFYKIIEPHIFCEQASAVCPPSP
jgi:hypothetical protein